MCHIYHGVTRAERERGASELKGGGGGGGGMKKSIPHRTVSPSKVSDGSRSATFLISPKQALERNQSEGETQYK